MNINQNPLIHGDARVQLSGTIFGINLKLFHVFQITRFSILEMRTATFLANQLKIKF